MIGLRSALVELAAAGLVTNDVIETLRGVIRWRGLAPARSPQREDPTRWLPADFTPSANRPVVQRRPNLRRLPKWKRPDRPGGETGWGGRWSLVHTPGTLGVAEDEDSDAEQIARQWLDRYGVVARDWWRRERPSASWRAIYQQLKRLEYRGEIRRGYFVRGLGGAQFALPDAIERLRSAATDEDAPFVAIAASDPANPYSLELPGVERAPLSRPRGRGAVLITRSGRVLMAAEGRGSRITVAPDVEERQVTEAALALSRHLTRAMSLSLRRRDIVVETIDGLRATASPHADAFRRAGFQATGSALRLLAAI
jgi:ATP-dependent Lhr-like helicase